MRALSTIAAFLAVATNSADAAESMSMSSPLFEAEMSMPDEGSMELRARYLRSSFGIRRTQSEIESTIKCVWNSGFDEAASHTKVCKKLKDEHSVAYTCDGEYMRVCCTVSSVVIPVFNTFGTCQKVGGTTDNGDEGLDLEMSMPMSMPESAEPEAEPEPTLNPTPEPTLNPTPEPTPNPTPEPTPNPTSGPTPETEPESESDQEPESGSEPGLSTISCTWKSTFEDAASLTKACKKLNNEFSVPYACNGDGGKKQVCCTVSVVETASFEKFGQCTKI